MSLRNTCIHATVAEFVDFVQRPKFHILENTTFRNLSLYPSSGKRRASPFVLGYLEITWRDSG
jgi:hypothetical protein